MPHPFIMPSRTCDLFVIEMIPPQETPIREWLCQNFPGTKIYHNETMELKDPKQLIDHLYDHRLKGDKVPDWAIKKAEDVIEADKVPDDFREHFGR